MIAGPVHARRWRLAGPGAAPVRDDGMVAPPGPGQVRVHLHAASINYRDLGIQAGHYPNAPDIVPLSDGAGVVEAVGDGVTEWSVGDRVATCFYPYWESGPATEYNHRASLGCELDGILADYANVPETGLVALPDHITSTDAATLPCAALTAWSALFTEGQLRAGQTVLIQGSGGVACYALQFARVAGARVIALTGSADKAARLRAMGASATINYRETPEWGAMVRQATGGAGADVIIELGGEQTLAQSLEAIATGGRIAVIGVLSGLTATIPIPPILFRHVYLTGITVGHRSDFRAMLAAVEQADLRPVIDQTLSFDDAAKAYAALPTGQHMGKIVIDYRV